MTTNAINTENLKQKLSSIFHSGGGEKSTKITPLSLINENPYETTLQHNLVVTTNLQLPSVTAENAVHVYNVSPIEVILLGDENGASISQYTDADEDSIYFFTSDEFLASIDFYDYTDESLMYYYSYIDKIFSNSNLNLSTIEIDDHKADMYPYFITSLEFCNVLDTNFASEAVKFPVKVPVIRLAKHAGLVNPDEFMSTWYTGILSSYNSDQGKKMFYYTQSEYEQINMLIQASDLEFISNKSILYPINADPILSDPDIAKAEFDSTNKYLDIHLNYPTSTDMTSSFSVYGVNLLVNSSNNRAYSKLILSGIEASGETDYVNIHIDLTNEDKLLQVLGGFDVLLMYDFIIYYGNPNPTPPRP